MQPARLLPMLLKKKKHPVTIGGTYVWCVVQMQVHVPGTVEMQVTC